MFRYARVPAMAGALIMLLLAVMHAGAAAPGNSAFQRTWERTDQPVLSGATARTWIWGPEANTQVMEEGYVEAPGGKRQVQYFDKSRMEINNPNGDPSSPFYVTNGLLVVELMTGRLQLGDNQFEQHQPAQVNIAGDPDDPLTYADLAPLRSAPAAADGAPITQRLDGNGQVSDDPSLAGQGVTAAYRVQVPGIDHQVASPFWTFLNSTGPVLLNGQTSTQRLFDPWFYATGLPITEAYWANVKVGGTPRLVLLQCFERRCLTYTPGNPQGFLVEAGNVGQHYRTWRYEQIPTGGTATATSSATRTATVTTTATSTTTATATSTATATNTATPTTTPEPATQYQTVATWGGRLEALANPAAAATDAQGNVYIAYNGTHQVVKMHPAGVYITSWGSLGSGPGQLNGPMGIAVDGGGYVYVADYGNKRIVKYDTNGVYITNWSTIDPVTQTAMAPYGIAVASDGRIFVTAAATGVARVQVYTANGEYVTQFGAAGSGNGEFYTPWGIDFDSNGEIYVVDYGNDRVQVFNAAFVYQRQFGGTGDGDGQFQQPFGIAIDSQNGIWVTDAGQQRVKRLSPVGTYITQFAYQGISFPAGVAIDDTDTVYAVDQGLDAVAGYNPQSMMTTYWYNTGRGAFARPLGVAIASDGTVLVSDDADQLPRIQRFGPGGQYLNELGEEGDGPGQFRDPRDVVVNSLGEFYVVDITGARVQKFSANGEYLLQWGSPGLGDNQFTAPVGLAVDGDDNVYVVDITANRVQKFTANGQYLGQFGSTGSGIGQLKYPSGVAVYGDIVYVTDTGNHRVQAFDRDGEFLFGWGSEGTGEGQFAEPTGIAVDADGYVYVTDPDLHRIQKFMPSGGLVVSLGSEGSGPVQFIAPAAIDIDADGNLYVTEFGNYRVQRLAPVE